MRLRLGDESIELTEFLAPKGRPMPADMRPNDRVFQHIAIIVSDMEKAYARLRQAGVEHASTGPQTLPDWNPNAARHQRVLLPGSRSATSSRFFISRRARDCEKWHRRRSPLPGHRSHGHRR